MKKYITLFLIAFVLCFASSAWAASSRRLPTAYITKTYGTAKNYTEGQIATFESDTDVNLTALTTLAQNESDDTILVADATPLDNNTGWAAGDTLTVDPDGSGCGPLTREVLSVNANTITLTASLGTECLSGENIAAGIVLDVYYEGVGGALWDETESITFAGATTSANYFRVIRAATGEGHSGIPVDDGSCAGFHNPNSFVISENYFSVQDLVFMGLTQAWGASLHVLTADEISIVGTLVYGNTVNSGSAFKIEPGSGQQAYVVNCLAYNIIYVGFWGKTGDAYFYNCTAANAYYGVYEESGNTYAKNVGVTGYTGYAFSGGVAQTTCSSSSPTYVGGTDFHLQSNDTSWNTTGTDLSADANYAFDDDIDTDARGWSIGFDYITPGGGGGGGGANTYWVDDNGAAAWGACKSETELSGASACTLATALANAVAGDTVYLRTGTYSTYINPTNSGSSGLLITFSNYNSEVVTVSNASYGLLLDGKSYVKVSGIIFTNIDIFMYIQNSANYNEVSGCTFGPMRNSVTWHGSSIWYNSSYNWIHGCTFTSFNQGGITGSLFDIGRELVYNDTSYYNLVENNEFKHGGHHCLGVYSKYNIVRNNRIHNENYLTYGYRPLLLEGYDSNYNLIEGNRVAFSGSVNHIAGMELRSSYNIVRYNDFFNNDRAGLSLNNQPAFMPGNPSNYNKIYNNTFYKNGLSGDYYRDGIALVDWGSGDPTGNIIKNNILYANQIDAIGLYDVASGSNTVTNNLLGTNPLFTDVSSAYTADSTALPNFVLLDGSPAIDQGTYLTTVAVADTGSGTALVVSDAGYFAAWNIPNADNDYIAVGTVSNSVQIASINYSTNTLTLANTISRQDGDPVWLFKLTNGTPSLKGAGVDMGAHEYNYEISEPETDPPTFTVNSGTDVGPTKNDTINVTVTDASSLSYARYGFSADGTCNASDTYSINFTSAVNFVISGNYTSYLCVSASDIYNNIGYQLVGQLNTDNTAPVVNITLPTGGTVAGTDTISFTVTGTGTDPECSVDNAVWVNCVTATTTFANVTGWAGIGAGAAFTLYMHDTDAAGNVGTTSKGYTKEGGSAGDIAACGTISTSGGSHLVSGNLTNAGGSCLVISGSNNTVDLGGYTITAATAAVGHGITITGSNNKVYNGKIAVGGGSQINVAGVYISGTGNEIYYLDIEASGGAITGEQYVNSVGIWNAPNKVHHVWGKATGSTTNISYAVDNIWATHRNSGGLEIHDCVLVGGHRGINADLVGYNVASPATSNIYNNYIQHTRTTGCKQPNGIGVTMGKNFNIYNNQIISDDGRGFITSSYGQGDPTGTSNINFYSNRVDVGYMVAAGGGAYPENHVAGTYSRYSTFNSTVRDNIIMVNNYAGTPTECSFSGSDDYDLQGNNTYSGNVCINRDTGTEVSAFRLAVNTSIYLTNNTYIAEDGLWIGNYDYYFTAGDVARSPLPAPTLSGNSVITPTSYTPSAPTGLALRLFSTDCYLLTWNDNRTTYPTETQTYEYYVWKDNVKISTITTRGGTFFVDTDVSGGAHDYKVSAVNLYGTEGSACANVNTSAATAGWTGAATDTTPPVLSGGSPSGAQMCPQNPYFQAISWNADENCTCKFSATNEAYADMDYTAEVTGGTFHHYSNVSTVCGASYTYYVRCTDLNGNVNTSSYPITFTVGTLDIDVTSPVCTIVAPGDDPYETSLTSVTITGTASDAVGVTSVTWTNADTGGTGTCTGTTAWSCTAALGYNSNSFTIKAFDAAGNYGSDTIEVDQDTPPTIQITSPGSGTYVSTDYTITVSGACQDDDTIDSVTWANDLGGSGACTVVGNTFTCAGIILFRGANTVTVEITDNDTNTSTDEIVISYLTTIFYISSEVGSDSNSGSSSDSPWATIAKVNAATFAAGDQILFKRGNVFDDAMLTMPSSGSDGTPIIIGVYGSGSEPASFDCGGETNCIDADGQTYVTVSKDIQMYGSSGARITGHDGTWTIGAGTYYVDATSGSDSYIGSESLPHQTLAKISASPWIMPGDIIYLKRGETFTGPLTVPASGTAAARITFKAYGNTTAAKPVIQ